MQMRMSLKIENQQLSVAKAKAEAEEVLRQKKDKYERRQLRSKVSRTLQNKANSAYQEQMKEKERIEMIQEKARKMQKEKLVVKTKDKEDAVVAPMDQEKNHLQIWCIRNKERNYQEPFLPNAPENFRNDLEKPDEVIVQNFNENQLQLIYEDPNYFIKDKEYRDRITLFEANNDEFEEDKNAKQRGWIIKQEFRDTQRTKQR